MAKFLNESKFVDKLVQDVDSKLSSKYTRHVTQSTATYVDYYNINNAASTVDSGFMNVDSVIGAESPIRYTEIKDFPLLEMTKVKLELDETDYGINSAYESEALIMPGTIVPMPNDVFVLRSPSHEPLLFMVTGFENDTIKSHNYIKISFKLKYTGDHYFESLARQTVTRMTCDIDELGSTGGVLIQDDLIAKRKTLQQVVDKLKNSFKRKFYNETFNSFIVVQEKQIPLSPDGSVSIGQQFTIYDRYMNRFIKENNFFNERKSYKTLYLSIEDDCPDFDWEYSTTLFYAIATRDVEILQDGYFFQELSYTSMPDSIFNFYNRNDVLYTRLVEYPDASGITVNPYLNVDFMRNLANGPCNYTDIKMQIISDFLWNNIKTGNDVPYDLYKRVSLGSYTRENMLLTVIVMYILDMYLKMKE